MSKIINFLKRLIFKPEICENCNYYLNEHCWIIEDVKQDNTYGKLENSIQVDPKHSCIHFKKVHVGLI